MNIEVIDEADSLTAFIKVSIQHKLHSVFYHVEEIRKITINIRSLSEQQGEVENWGCEIKLNKLFSARINVY